MRRARATVGIGLAAVLLAVTTACRHEDEEPAAPARLVAFAARDGEYALYTVGSDGRGLARVGAVSPGIGGGTLLVPSPQYDRLIVSDRDEKLRVLDAEGLHDLAPDYGWAAWSPDGERVAVAGPGPGLWLVDADGGNQRQLTRNTGRRRSGLVARRGADRVRSKRCRDRRDRRRRPRSPRRLEVAAPVSRRG